MGPIFVQLISSLWSTVNLGVRKAQDLGWLRSEDLHSKVISVGNLQAGGAGKTPLVAKIAREADEQGLEACILTRGYQGKWQKAGGVIRPGDEAVDPSIAGDEVALLQLLCPKAWIGVGSDRVKQYQKALALRDQRKFDCVILDDGFQHWKIKKNVEIIALTSKLPGEVVFRDFPSALKRADLVILSKGVFTDEQFEFYLIKNKSAPPLVHVRVSSDFLPGSAYKKDPELLKRRLYLVTGLADGEFVKVSLEKEGFSVPFHISNADHARYTHGEVHKLLNEARKQRCTIALTGKDWVKWKALGISEDEVLVFETKIQISEGTSDWKKVLWES